MLEAGHIQVHAVGASSQLQRRRWEARKRRGTTVQTQANIFAATSVVGCLHGHVRVLPSAHRGVEKSAAACDSNTKILAFVPSLENTCVASIQYCKYNPLAGNNNGFFRVAAPFNNIQGSSSDA